MGIPPKENAINVIAKTKAKLRSFLMHFYFKKPTETRRCPPKGPFLS